MGKFKDIQQDEDRIEKNWNIVWRPILEKQDGSIDVTQLKLELMDFSDMIKRMTSLTSQITDGNMSYPTYPVETIIQVAGDVQQERIQRQIEEDKEDGLCSFCNSDINAKEQT